MILQPSIVALLVSSIIICLMTIYATCFGLIILRRWDITSGSGLQLALERRTYLVSTIMSWLLIFQLGSLFFFISTVDSICHLFVGAMCAVGSLAANSLGYPTLVLKIVTFLLASLWLILNHADNRCHDYPLIRTKYRLLMIMAPFSVGEMVLQVCYFLKLRPDIITSCCGSLYQSSRLATAGIMAVPPMPMTAVFYACMVATIGLGTWFVRWGQGGGWFALLSGISFPVAITAIISVISLYIYELPSHHCPFCLLQQTYRYVGYPLYGLLLLAAATGLGVGALQRHRLKGSLHEVVPQMQKLLAGTAVTALAIFTIMVSFLIQVSSLRMDYHW